MPNDRFYIEKPFKKNTQISMDGEEFHHLHHVMRKKKNDRIELINGANQLAYAQIISIDKHSCFLEITSLMEKPSTHIQLILCLAHCLSHRLDNILEKATELGVTAFYLFPSTYSEKYALSDNRTLRMKKKIISALKQGGRLDMPLIIKKDSLMDCRDSSCMSFFGDIRENAPFLLTQQNISSCQLFIGPEKGFSEKEIRVLEQDIKAKGIRLHENILRTDTAAILGIGTLFQMQHLPSS